MLAVTYVQFYHFVFSIKKFWLELFSCEKVWLLKDEFLIIIIKILIFSNLFCNYSLITETHKDWKEFVYDIYLVVCYLVISRIFYDILFQYFFINVFFCSQRLFLFWHFRCFLGKTIIKIHFFEVPRLNYLEKKLTTIH